MEYIISFSFFYKAAYAKDILEEVGINSSMRKLPTELVRSCSTGLYIKHENVDAVKKVFYNKNIVPRGIYRINKSEKGNVSGYTKI